MTGTDSSSRKHAGYTPIVLLAFAAIANAVQFPTYALSTTTKFPGSMSADIAGSSFMGADGRFHFISSAATYEQSDTGGSFVRTFTADNFGVMAKAAVTPVTYNTYWNRPGAMCYQLDKRAVKPMPTLYQDDHCDVIGVWVDPATQTWWGVVNDEFQFAPWQVNKTQNQRIATGLHNNRVLLSSSKDQGVTWEVVDELLTDEYQPESTITAELFPKTTYSWGLSGTRFYIDYPTGYAYCLYNHQVRNKSGDATLAKWFSLARAPLKDGLELESWRKYYDGKWDQPRKGGKDGLIGESLGFNVAYDPKTDYLAYEGTGADGKQYAFKSTPLVNKKFTFSDVSGNTYTGDATANTITLNGQTVGTVSYHDPALNRDFTIGVNAAGKLAITSTDSYGASTPFLPGSVTTVFKDATTNRLYVQPTTINESAFTYNVQGRKYRSVGYDNYVYENDDIGQPNAWVPVGVQPDSVAANAAYLSALDTGSLTNQWVSTRTYSMLSDLRVTFDTMTMTPHSSSQPSFSHDTVPNDAAGQPLASNKQYKVSLGGSQLGASWTFEPVKDTYATAYNTGFYRLKNAAGQYLQVPGATAADQRKWGAATGLGAALPAFDPAGNNGKGAPGGSDQWYILPYSNNSPGAGGSTSLKDSVGYKLVNRNSGLVVVSQDGQFVTVPNEFTKNAAQQLVIQPSAGARRSRVAGAL